MKRYESILKRVEAYEKKCQIQYAKSSGKLFSVLRSIFTIGIAYMFIINSLLCLSIFIRAEALGRFNIMPKARLIALTVLTILSVVFLIFTYFKGNIIKIYSLFAILVSNLYIIFALYTISNTGFGFFNMLPFFYWRHLPSFVIILVTALWMCVIIIREEYKVRFRYNKIINNLYRAYKKDSIVNFSAVSAEEWDEFLRSYDPTAIKINKDN